MSTFGSRTFLLAAALLAAAGPAAAQRAIDTRHNLGLMADVLADTTTVPDGVIPIEAPHLRLVRDDTLVPAASLGSTVCLAALDWDGDGDQDVLVGNTDVAGVPSHLLVNDGGGRWRVERPPGLPAMILSAAAGDLDGDGRDDLAVIGREDIESFDITSADALARPGRLLERYLQRRLVVLLTRDGGFAAADVAVPADWQERFGGSTGGPGGGPVALALADVDRDGDLDLVAAMHDSEHPILPASAQLAVLMNDGGRFAAAQVIPMGSPPGSDLNPVPDFSVCDLDDDGWPDLAVNMSGSFFINDAPVLVHPNRGGVFAVLPDTLDCGREAKGTAPVFLDADMDGDLDLLAGQLDAHGGRNNLYLQGPPGRWRFVGAASGLWGAYSIARSFGWGDLDNDGLPDLVPARHGAEGLPRPIPVLRNLGGGRFGTVLGGLEPPLETALFALLLVDLDDDGDLDLLAAPMALYVDLLDVEATRTIAYRNVSRGGRSLALRLQGTRSGASVPDARARVVAAGRASLRLPGEGRLSGTLHPPRDIHVGLGAADACDSVTVRWPSGLVECWTDLEAGRLHVLVEGRGDRP